MPNNLPNNSACACCGATRRAWRGNGPECLAAAMCTACAGNRPSSTFEPEPPPPIDLVEDFGFITVNLEPVASLPIVARCYTCNGEWDNWSGFDQHFDHCEDCGDAYCPNGFAEHCCPDYDEYDEGPTYRSGGIHDYSYTPDLQFRGDGPYHLGIELEIGTNNLNASPLYEWASDNGATDLFYAKQDGSVAGFEIVTHPMTPDYFLGFDWPGFFDMLKSEYPTYRNREPNGHGLHVHVSRTAFPNALALCRWSYLFNRNEQEVARIARRTSNNWAAFSATPVKDTKPVQDSSEWTWKRDEWGNRMVDPWGNYIREFTKPWFQARLNGYPNTGGDRYKALNMQNHETVEVRVFKSTRNAQEFVDSVSLVAATVDFVRSMQPQHMTSVASLNWARFCDWVINSPYAGSYPTLANDPEFTNARCI